MLYNVLVNSGNSPERSCISTRNPLIADCNNVAKSSTTLCIVSWLDVKGETVRDAAETRPLFFQLHKYRMYLKAATLE